MRKPPKLPIGVSDFAKLIENDYIFIDKTLFIKDIIDDGAEIILLLRPRRFGKTLNMSMLKYFFSRTIDKDLFIGLKIKETSREHLQHQQRYPVIYLTLKDIKASKFTNAQVEFKILLAELYREHREILQLDTLSAKEKSIYQQIMDEEADIEHHKKALQNLTKYLYRYYGEKPIILLDEYDTPIQAAYMQGYHDEMVDFMRSFLGSALKDNEYLYKAVVTGVLRVSQASLFSGLNNMRVYSLLSDRYGEYFGFLSADVTFLLKKCDVYSKKIEQLKEWYNGYQIGKCTLYNPWSIICFIDDNLKLQPYWLNTADNSLLGKLLIQANSGIKDDFENLLQNKSIEKTINEHTVFLNLDKSSDALWGLLLFSGYLKVVATKMVGINKICSLKIPNIEVSGVYIDLITRWFSNPLGYDIYQLFLTSLTTGDIDLFGRILQEYMYESASYFDFDQRTTEKMYHIFILGLIAGLRDKYFIKSNREIGTGRCDVLLIPQDKNQLGLVLEFKNAKEEDKLKQSVKEALQQIEDKDYDTELHQHNVKNILHVGIAFAGKKTLVGARRCRAQKNEEKKNGLSVL